MSLCGNAHDIYACYFAIKITIGRHLSGLISPKIDNDS